MHVVITGGSGLVGTHAARFFLERGHRITAIGRRAHHPLTGSHAQFAYLSADTTTAGPWQDRLKTCQAVLNLAGQSIFGRWTPAYKNQLRSSRIATTRRVVEGLSDNPPTVLISASAVGFYGDRGDIELTEGSAPGEDFLAHLSRDWEATALEAQTSGHRVVIPRLGIVLASNGGALAKMLPAFRSWIGGPLGGGQQWFPWIHIQDLLQALAFLLDTPSAKGPFNCTALHPVRNRDFSRALGRALNRPAFMTAPAFIIKTLLGEFGDTLLASQRALPKALTDAGFKFKHAQIDDALQDLLGHV